MFFHWKLGCLIEADRTTGSTRRQSTWRWRRGEGLAGLNLQLQKSLAPLSGLRGIFVGWNGWKSQIVPVNPEGFPQQVIHGHPNVPLHPPPLELEGIATMKYVVSKSNACVAQHAMRHAYHCIWMYLVCICNMLKMYIYLHTQYVQCTSITCPHMQISRLSRDAQLPDIAHLPPLPT